MEETRKMKYGKKYINLEKGLKKEWIITNGIGGYASSTIIGANTRKYHGLLIAPLTPPARRFLILSKVDEAIEIAKFAFHISDRDVHDEQMKGIAECLDNLTKLIK